MIKKNLLISTMVLVFAGGIALLPLTTSAQDKSGKEESADHKVVVYYFHTNTRCSTCRKIEEYSREAIEKGFPNELKDGRLEFKLVNYELSHNRHFIRDYKLVTKSLVLVDLVNDEQKKWTNLRLVWQLTKRKDAFLNYVRGEVRNYLSQN